MINQTILPLAEGKLSLGRGYGGEGVDSQSTPSCWDSRKDLLFHQYFISTINFLISNITIIYIGCNTIIGNLF